MHGGDERRNRRGDSVKGYAASMMSSWKSLRRCYADPEGSSARQFQIHPDNRLYVAWKHFILLWAAYSSFFTPMEFGFFRGLPENIFLLDIAGQLVFLADIVVRFLVAYHDTHSHSIVYDRNRIAIRYLKSRFFLDLLSCFPWDYIYKATGRKEAVRYLLWIRLSRALRITEFFNRLQKNIRVNYMFTRIVKLLVVEMYCTHTAACIFYYLATTVPPSEEGYTWIGSLTMGDRDYSDFRHIHLWKRYVTSLYFAVVTMATVGYGDIHAVNVKEMIFVMIYVSFDMILGAYLIGNMTALIVKGSKTERFRDKMTEIIKYLNKNNLDNSIRNAIIYHMQLEYDRSYTEPSVLHDIPATIRTKGMLFRVHQADCKTFFRVHHQNTLFNLQSPISRFLNFVTLIQSNLFHPFINLIVWTCLLPFELVKAFFDHCFAEFDRTAAERAWILSNIPEGFGATLCA